MPARSAPAPARAPGSTHHTDRARAALLIARAACALAEMAPLYKKCRLLGIDVPQLSAQAKSSGKEKHRNKLLAECRKRKHQLSHTLKNVKWARVAAITPSHCAALRNGSARKIGGSRHTVRRPGKVRSSWT